MPVVDSDMTRLLLTGKTRRRAGTYHTALMRCVRGLLPPISRPPDRGDPRPRNCTATWTVCPSLLVAADSGDRLRDEGVCISANAHPGHRGTGPPRYGPADTPNVGLTLGGVFIPGHRLRAEIGEALRDFFVREPKSMGVSRCPGSGLHGPAARDLS